MIADLLQLANFGHSMELLNGLQRQQQQAQQQIVRMPRQQQQQQQSQQQSLQQQQQQSQQHDHRHQTQHTSLRSRPKPSQSGARGQKNNAQLLLQKRIPTTQSTREANYDNHHTTSTTQNNHNNSTTSTSSSSSSFRQHRNPLTTTSSECKPLDLSVKRSDFKPISKQRIGCNNNRTRLIKIDRDRHHQNQSQIVLNLAKQINQHAIKSIELIESHQSSATATSNLHSTDQQPTAVAYSRLDCHQQYLNQAAVAATKPVCINVGPISNSSSSASSTSSSSSTSSLSSGSSTSPTYSSAPSSVSSIDTANYNKLSSSSSSSSTSTAATSPAAALAAVAAATAAATSSHNSSSTTTISDVTISSTNGRHHNHHHNNHRQKKQKGATKSHLCNHCGRSFSRSDMLTRHSRLHSGHKPYQCGKCLQVFSRSDHLSTHERTHTGEKPYQCEYCAYSACRRDMITRHMRTHTGQQSGQEHQLASTTTMLMARELSGDDWMLTEPVQRVKRDAVSTGDHQDGAEDELDHDDVVSRQHFRNQKRIPKIELDPIVDDEDELD